MVCYTDSILYRVINYIYNKKKTYPYSHAHISPGLVISNLRFFGPEYYQALDEHLIKLENTYKKKQEIPMNER